MRRGRKPGSKNKKPSSSQKPGIYNQHFPTLSDDEEKRLDRYVMTIREVRVNGDSHGSLNDCVRLVVRSNRRGTLRSSLLDLLREDEIIQARVGKQAPKEVVERAYRDSMADEVEELSRYSLFGKYTPDALDQVQQLGSDEVDKEIKSRAPNLYELLHGLCRASTATPEGHNV